MEKRVTLISNQNKTSAMTSQDHFLQHQMDMYTLSMQYVKVQAKDGEEPGDSSLIRLSFCKIWSRDWITQHFQLVE